MKMFFILVLLLLLPTTYISAETESKKGCGVILFMNGEPRRNNPCPTEITDKSVFSVADSLVTISEADITITGFVYIQTSATSFVRTK